MQHQRLRDAVEMLVGGVDVGVLDDWANRHQAARYDQADDDQHDRHFDEREAEGLHEPFAGAPPTHSLHHPRPPV